MKELKANYEILTPIDGMEMLRAIERAGRVCYKSEDRISSDSTETFIRNIMERGHESVLEHRLALCMRNICSAHRLHVR